jgi:hypothetical protein
MAVERRPAVAAADRHRGAPRLHGLEQALDVARRQMQDVAVDEQHQRRGSVSEAGGHRGRLALIGLEMDRLHLGGAGDLHRRIGRAVGDHQDLVQEGNRAQGR